MEDTLQLLIDTLNKYDSYLVEECYNKLLYDGFVYNNFGELLDEVVKAISREIVAYSEKEVDFAQYEMKEEILARYERVKPIDVYGYAFPEDSLQISDEIDSKNGRGNAIRMDIINQWESDEYGIQYTKQVGIQTVITDDLRFITVLPKRVENKDIVMSNINLNSYFGNRRLRRNIDKIFGLIVEVDGVTKESQILHILQNMDNGKIPEPNFLVNSGHGLHFYYLLDEPIAFHEKSYSVYPVITNILNGIKDLIWTPKATDLKSERMDLNKGYTIIGNANRKNKDLIVTAYKVKQEKYSLQYLRSFINKPVDDPDYDITFPTRSKMSIYEAAEKYPHWTAQRRPDLFDDEELARLLQEIAEREEKVAKKGYDNRENKSRGNHKVYDWFYNLIKEPENYHHGNRYNCIMCLAIYGVKCGIKKEVVKKDLMNLLPLYNDVKPINYDENFLLNERDVDNALTVYKNDYAHLHTFEWIKQKIGIIYESKTKRREIPLKQEEHLEIAREERDKKHPDGSWRAYSDGAVKQDILDYMRANPDAKKKEYVEKEICSWPTIKKYWDECRKELGLEILSNLEKVRLFRKNNHDATKAECSRALGVSKTIVGKYWDL